MKQKNIGLEVQKIKEECGDSKCPFHGTLKIRGRMMRGVVIKQDTHRTVTVEFLWNRYLPKYERFEKKRTRIRAHNPKCINAQVGDLVLIVESKKISKTKSFVVVEVIKK